MSSIPWVEAYRPTDFESVVLDPLNKKILKNIIDTSYFPNLLFYGPPGTGKTTTIINLVSAYQEKMNQKNKSLMIHLNASDERGIDIIRNQINQFVNSKSLFQDGMKFVILDEVDYMTKNAQQALRYLLQNYSTSIRFCLICNYISKIDEGLQNEFLRLRFNQLPESDIVGFLNNIVKSEKLNFTNDSLYLIQKLYRSDIRSMINFLQSNQNILDTKFYVIDDATWLSVFLMFKNESIEKISTSFKEISEKYNIDKKNVIKYFINYIIRKKSYVISNELLTFIENIMHYQECKNSVYINYATSRLIQLLSNKISTFESS
jgi:replication factor C subunit 3/5